MSFLIFYLKQESLQVYRFSQNLVLVDKIFDNNFLNLSENFENLWQNCWSIINLESEIYFILGQNASFTDTRIVYLWLQSWQMFGCFRNLENENLNSTNLENSLETKNGEIDNKKSNKNELQLKKIKKLEEIILKQFWVHKLERNLVLEFLENVELKELFANIKLANNNKLLYTSSARIGQKIEKINFKKLPNNDEVL